MGMLFVFDRRTGEPLYGIEERAVPQNGVAGEVLSPTQPFSALPSLVPNAPLTKDDAWGFTPWDRGKCADEIAALRSEGIYTPPSLQGTIEWPGYAGRIELGQRVVRSGAPAGHREHESSAVRRAVDPARRPQSDVRIEACTPIPNSRARPARRTACAAN